MELVEGQPQSTRILWIDFAKVIGIVLVVLGHMQNGHTLTNIIYSFHMPLFFFLSGYLEKDRNVKVTIVSGIKTLLIPYVILYFFYYLWWFVVSLLRHPEIFGRPSLDNALVKPLLGMIFGVGYNTDFSTMIDVPLWFLAGLFFTKIIHTVIRCIAKNNTLFYLLLNLVTIGIIYIIEFENIDVLFSIDSALLSVPFFSIGNVLKRNQLLKRFESVNCRGLLQNFTIAAVGFIILVIFVPINGRVDVNHCIYGKNLILFYIIALLGIVSTVFLSLLYTHGNKIITVISIGTIIILAFHGIMTGILYKIFGLGGEGFIINPVIGILVALLNVSIFIIPTMIIQKYFSIIIGGRK